MGKVTMGLKYPGKWPVIGKSSPSSDDKSQKGANLLDESFHESFYRETQ